MIICSVIILKRILVRLLDSICCGIRSWGFCWSYISCFIRCLILISIYSLIRLNDCRVCNSFIRIIISFCWLTKSWYIWDVVFRGFFLRGIARINRSFFCCIYSRVFYSLYYGVVILRCCLWIYIFSNLRYFRFLYYIFRCFILLNILLGCWDNVRIRSLVIVSSSICGVLFRELLILVRVVSYVRCNGLIFKVVFI